MASPTFRHPVPFARELVTLDDISAGRLTLGIGAGADQGWDAGMLGDPWPRAERTARFAEFLELTDLLLRTPAASYRGEYYVADEARTYPGCVQQPRVPFAVAATGPRGMHLAATFGDTWVSVGDRAAGDSLPAAEGARVVAAQMARVDEVCAAIGREPASLQRLALTGQQLDGGLASPAAFEETVGCYEEVGVTDLVVQWPRDSEPYAADLATFERIFGT